MNTKELAAWELPDVTSEDIEEVMEYIQNLGNTAEVLDQEGERLGIQWRDFLPVIGPDSRAIAQIHFGLLLAERQRDRMLLEQLTGDPEDLKTI